FLTIGGGMAAYPEMRTLVVDVHHWLSDQGLIHIYSVGQMSPGPNMMMVAAVGERVAGIPGAALAAIAFFVPTGLLTFGIGRLWTRLANWPWRASIQRGLGPVAIGLAVAGLVSFGRGTVTGWITAAVALVVFFATLNTKLNPALLILGGALVGGLALR
ncbi:MAG TPA: chromate transporter, partial [Candidatus Tumulicola sp.]|nr:chromate transporter [Candidatus Tumulicola sp.]